MTDKEDEVFLARIVLLFVIEVIVGIGVVIGLLHPISSLIILVLFFGYMFWNFRNETWELLKLWSKRIRGDKN